MRTSLLSIVILIFFPISSFALGLGDVEVESRLNEKLSAKIDITSATDRDIESLDVSFASNKDYKRSGLDKSDYTYKIKIKLNNEGDKNYISLTSEDVFREPLVQLLLDVQWYAGHLLKDYSIFLDPPDIQNFAPTPLKSEATSQKVVDIEQTDNEIVPSNQDSSKTKATNASKVPSLVKSTNEIVYGPTIRSDTLWKIALKMRPDESITVEQMMLAIQAENQNAFVDNNINKLLAGYTLTVVNDADAIKSLSPVKARNIASQQVKDWKKGRRSKNLEHPGIDSHKDDNKQTGTATSPVNESTTAKSSLVLVGQKETKAVDKDESPKSLSDKLILAEEQVESVSLENENLKQRISHLEQIIEKRLSLIDLKDENLAQLQKQLKADILQELKSTGQLGGDTSDSGNSDAEDSETETIQKAKEDQVTETDAQEQNTDNPKDTPTTSIDNKSKSQDSKPVVTKPAVTKPAVTKPAVMKPVVQKSVLEQTIELVLNNIIYVGIALGLLIILLLLKVFKNKSKSENDFKESILDENAELADYENEDGEHDDSLDTKVDPSSLLEEETSFLSDFSTSELDSLQNDEEENDPLSEADVFIVYGRYEQAEKLLLKYIESNPDDIDYKVKLLEVYHADNNSDKFSPLFNQTKNLLASTHGDVKDSSYWEKIENYAIDLNVNISDAYANQSNVSEDKSVSEEVTEKELADDEIDIDDLERQLNEFEEMLAGDFDDTDDTDASDDSINFESDDFDVDDELGLADMDLDDSELDDMASSLSDFDSDIQEMDLELDSSEIDSSENDSSENDSSEIDNSEIDTADDVESSFDMDIDLDDENGLDDLEEEISLTEENKQDDEVINLDADIDTNDIENSDLSLDLDELSLDLEEADKIDAEQIDEDESAGGANDISIDLELDADETTEVEKENLSDESETTNEIDLDELSLDLEEDLAVDSELASDTLKASNDLDDELDINLDEEIKEPAIDLDDELDISLELDADNVEQDIAGKVDLATEVELDEPVAEISLDDELGNISLEDELDEISLEDGEPDDIDLNELSLDLEESIEVNNTNDENIDLIDLNLENVESPESEDLSEITDELESLSLDLDDEDEDIDSLGSKLDLARAYIEMGDNDSAIKAIHTVLSEGDDSQKEEAKKLLEMTK
ncbi:MAG: hypothetical protein HQL46_11765 [Gammaproteobacteria bacterium]|nr:hypothetical protein [Gammaproteobacteria bacterium]